MGCCFSRPPPPPGLYAQSGVPNHPWAIGPGFYDGENIVMENMLKNLERQGLPVPTKDIFGKPLVRMPCVKESELAAAVAADPEFWLMPRDNNGQPLQGEELAQWQAMHQPVNPRPGMKRTVLPGGRVVYKDGYDLFGEWRENLHR